MTTGRLACWNQYRFLIIAATTQPRNPQDHADNRGKSHGSTAHPQAEDVYTQRY